MARKRVLIGVGFVLLLLASPLLGGYNCRDCGKVIVPDPDGGSGSLYNICWFFEPDSRCYELDNDCYSFPGCRTRAPGV